MGQMSQMGQMGQMGQEDEPQNVPEVVMKKKPDPVRTRARIPLRKRRPVLQESLNSEMPSFNAPRAAFQTKFAPQMSSEKAEEDEEAFVFDQSIDPFQDIAADFEVNNEDWISTISQAFEGFSDFKKLNK